MWPRIVNIALGLWLMVAPSVLDYGDPAAANDRIVGPIAAALAVIAVWEATRPLRWVNVVLGLWLVIAPFSQSDERIVGAIGVIGPTRMNYARIIPMVDYTAKIVSGLLSN